MSKKLDDWGFDGEEIEKAQVNAATGPCCCATCAVTDPKKNSRQRTTTSAETAHQRERYVCVILSTTKSLRHRGEKFANSVNVRQKNAASPTCGSTLARKLVGSGVWSAGIAC